MPPQTEPLQQLPATGTTNVRKGASMRNDYRKWSLPLCTSCHVMHRWSWPIHYRLAPMHAEKHHSTYSTVMALLRCRLSIALLWSSITCLRNVQSSFHNPSQIDLGTSGNSNQAMSNVLKFVHLYAHVAYSLVLWACQLQLSFLALYSCISGTLCPCT